MGEKQKNSAQKHSLKRVFTQLAIVLLSLPMLCGACLSLVAVADYLWDYQCFTEAEAIEWPGVMQVGNADENRPLISQENAAELVILSSENLNVSLPLIPYYSPISHPAQSYFLTVKHSNWGRLAVCQPNGWASDMLSETVNSYSFSPDGRFFALSSTNTIEIYDASSIELYKTQEFPELGIIGKMAFHPTEPLLAFLVNLRDRQGLYIWNYEAQSGLIAYPFQREGWTRFLSFNEDGTLLILAVDAARGGINVWGIPAE